MYLLYFVQTKQAKKKEQQSTAHIWNLNPDPQLSGMIVYLLQQGWSSKNTILSVKRKGYLTNY